MRPAGDYRFVLREPAREPLLLEGVPAGEYRWSFESDPGGWTFPPPPRPGRSRAGLPETSRSRLRIRAGATAELEIPLTGSGALEVLVREQDGSPHAGRIRIGLVRGRSFSARTHGAPPHRITGLRPGTFEVRLMEAWGRALEDGPAVEVAVLENARASCVLHVPSP
ncbi:MAG: hypothetical protein CMJ84_07145 [Planctomycetes bacterium]|nr:hypothetical protein [Planctomycetota bacterium]MDP6408931.1 hypothetical protein [Planctomycetota bacterium]